MEFEIVSKRKQSTDSIHKIVNEKNIVQGILIYTTESGQDAIFKFTETIRGISYNREYPVNPSELSIIGCKYCYCVDRLGVIKYGTLVRYIPEIPFDRHTYNNYKFKPGSIVLAEIVNDIAYVVSKQECRKKKA